MLDIKGQQINIGDRVLVSSKYYGLVLTTLVKESSSNYYFGGGVERLAKVIKNQYVGYDEVDRHTGLPWVGIRNTGGYGYSNMKDRVLKGKGTNGSRYITKDISGEKQTRVLKVEDDFTL